MVNCRCTDTIAPFSRLSFTFLHFSFPGISESSAAKIRIPYSEPAVVATQCGECHNPRDAIFAISAPTGRECRPDRRLAASRQRARRSAAFNVGGSNRESSTYSAAASVGGIMATLASHGSRDFETVSRYSVAPQREPGNQPAEPHDFGQLGMGLASTASIAMLPCAG